MENILIERHFEDDFEPSVDFNATTGTCVLAGESYLDYSTEFYEPLINWFKQYFEEVKGPINLDIRLTYFNTSSSKHIYMLLTLLKEYENSGGKVNVNWHFESKDEELVYEVDDLKIASGLNISYFFDL